ncbi:MAG: peptidoglycan editing factor PgeF [Gammaproteobacteria bacterium]
MQFLEPNWPCPPGIRACTTLRTTLEQASLSTGLYAGFNLAMHVGDDPVSVQKNRECLSKALNLRGEPFWLNQVHGVDAVCLNDFNQVQAGDPLQAADIGYVNFQKDQKNVRQGQGAEAPGAWANIPVVLTADCLPVLMADTKGEQIAAIHAGWKGIAAGILERALSLFLELGIPKNQVLIWLGPGIGPNAFEVGAEVRDLFLALNAENVRAFRTVAKNFGSGKYLGNLYQLAHNALGRAGALAQNIYSQYLCTYSDSERFFSYRRDHQTGRMATLIWKA